MKPKPGSIELVSSVLSGLHDVPVLNPNAFTRFRA